MTKPTNRWFGPFCAHPPTKPPGAPKRLVREVQKTKSGPYKRVLIPRNPDWRLGDSEVPRAASAGEAKLEEAR